MPVPDSNSGQLCRTHLPQEEFWISHQPFLESRGYLLRPRYRSGWVPSWTLPNANFDPKLNTVYEYEDSVHEGRVNVLDAIRISDGAKVILKRVRTWTDEIGLGLYFSSEKLLKDPHNRTYRLLDVIPLSDDDAFAIIVMPFLREFGSPIFRHLNEVVDAMRQFLQGLKFMHTHNVAHRDACAGNMMMDATNVIPGGYHFSAPWTQDGVTYGVQWQARSSVSPVDYYWIDFGLSDHCPDGPERTRDVGIFGQDKTVPELSETVPYNPFKVDIYQLGNAFKALVEKYPGMATHFEPIVTSMTLQDPDERPTAHEALADFEAICSQISLSDLADRLYLRPPSSTGYFSGGDDTDYELVWASESESGDEDCPDPQDEIAQ